LNVINATITNLDLTTSDVTNLKSTNATITNATITNLDVASLKSTNATITSLDITNLDLTTLDVTNLKSTNATITNATITNLDVASLKSTNATITSLDITNASIDNLYITYGLKKIVVNQTATNITLVATDLNKIHNFSNAASSVVILPEVNSGDIGAWIQCRKKGTGYLDLKRAGSNTIINATHIKNTATDTWSYVDLILENATNWGIQSILGDWVTS